MRRIALFATVTALLATAATGSAGAVYPDTIALPNGWLPEGISIAPGGTFYAGSRANGAVYGGSLRTGEGAIVVPGVAGRVAVGVDYDRGRLFVAGGGTGDAFVYDAETGDEIAAYDFAGPPTNTFVNDVVVTRTAAWFTESRSAVLYKVPLGPDGTPAPTFETVPLTSPSPATPPANSNGIDATPNGKTLIIVQSDPGKLFTVDPGTGVADEIELTGGSGNVVNGDGIHLDGKTLYVVQNRLNQIAVIELETDLSAGAIVGLITSPNFDVPTTIDEFGKWLYAVNARFGTPSPETATYAAVQVEKA
ncbi:MAG: superoxide dismutase [Gaiellaceae bacterium]